MAEKSPSPIVTEQSAIRDAACVVVIDDSTPEPTLLMGRRHADQIFLPDKWVFPGGRVDAADRQLAQAFAGPYAPPDLARELRPFALAAVRELREETGLVIGAKPVAADDSDRTLDEGEFTLAPSRLFPLARAITPPGRVRRYDTWFFIAARSAVATLQETPDGELLDLDWFTLTEARALDLPNITRLVLDDVSIRLRSAPQPGSSSGSDLPFYYEDACGFQRVLISCTMAPCTP